MLSNICIEPRARKVGHVVRKLLQYEKMAAQQSSINSFETKTCMDDTENAERQMVGFVLFSNS